MLNVAIAGTGFMGKMHAACYDVIEGARVAFVYSRHKENAAALASGAPGRSHGRCMPG